MRRPAAVVLQWLSALMIYRGGTAGRTSIAGRRGAHLVGG